MSKLILSKKEANDYIKKGKEWVKNHPDHSILENTRVLPYIIISEYIANQDNKSILLIKKKKENRMSELLKRMKQDLKESMKKEIYIRKNKASGDFIVSQNILLDQATAVKEVIRSIISMFPEIGVKPNESSDLDVSRLLKKYIQIEKIRTLYTQHVLVGSDVMEMSPKELISLQKKKIEEMGNNLTSIKIKIAQSYLPEEASKEEIVKWIKENINFNDYKNKMQSIKPIMEYFKSVNGNTIKQIILSM